MNESTELLLDAGIAGLGDLFELKRTHLRSFLERRINRKVTSRLDASDVIQEVFVRAQQALPAYLAQPVLPPLIWLRKLGLQVLCEMHRKQFRSKRNPFREEAPFDDFLVKSLVNSSVSVDRKVQKEDLQSQIVMRLRELSEIDRQVLEMRHVEGYSLAEIANLLELEFEAIKKRYYRALKRFKGLVGPSIDE